MKITVIIPSYNEWPYIKYCLISLSKQTIKHEIIAVDDGSKDKTYEKLVEFIKEHHFENLKLLKQDHLGPAQARNLGAKNALGEILVFVDADMTFSSDFLQQLTNPILENKFKGTFSKNEKVANWDNFWAKSWNYNQNLANDLRIPSDYPLFAPVFRAILKSEFERVGGFTKGLGWVDDWSLSKKLGYKASSTQAVYYHHNPETLFQVFKQANWIGKNVFLTGNISLFVKNLMKYSFLVSILLGFFKSIKFKLWKFFIFKIIYDFGITSGILSTLFSTNRNK
ncbi:MAG: hypothetical protein UR52_C0001G0013 [Candidatus Gottesmanbacteria bacterium GW2011_GWA1_34_13]|uniref:Glycosyltransferase 2-like domain-containing protein n=1 Tax=Candidatus Gottesmanbacteria bacterium GW2011_GWA1_34_13 TaxID=1618434 RepID=A0A0G0ASA0_9BACT|nr:MAG: hypothetical protein UR52_C0001G0013 [Candidatus Gottesmanbacteria bacterium GW2011_GWA1_34_13]